jgi:hypothetical protein
VVNGPWSGRSLDRFRAGITVSSFPLNLKPFGLCAALQQGEIFRSFSALILSMTAPIKSNPVGGIGCDEFNGGGVRGDHLVFLDG